MERTGILAGATMALLIAAGQASATQGANIEKLAPKTMLLAQAADQEPDEERRKNAGEEEKQQEQPAPEPSSEQTPEPEPGKTSPAPQQEQAEPEPEPKPVPEPETAPEPQAAPERSAEPEKTESEQQPGESPAEVTPPQPTQAEPAPQAEQPQPAPERPAEPEKTDTKSQPGEPPAEATPPQPTQAPPAPQGQQPAAPDSRADSPAENNEAATPAREAPLPDSAKESRRPESGGTRSPRPTEPAAPPPSSDAEAQQLEQPVTVRPLREEEGRRISRREERRERHEGVDVLREIGDRLIIQLGNRTVVQSDDRGRIGRDASEVYYEELPRGRTRETILRPNGVQVITIRDRYGDVVRRSRIMPDGREYVLVYAGDERRDRDRSSWRDPGHDLPPLHLSIPARDYIFDARRSEDPRAYYDFLDQPPVEPVRQLYSIDDVRYSARLRDSVRRIDLDTITFDFGSATIAENAVPRLAALADAMARLLDENPAESFLIEGHTDAVGSDLANLALSDRRAEAVAAALTDVFDIPPENLITQGYGETYLKVNTQEPERENRRVAVRRITPLITPASARR